MRLDVNEFQKHVDAQGKYKRWCGDENRTIGGLIKVLPQKFFNLTDKLIVARTRKLIEKTLGEDLGFPKKTAPQNIYQGVDHFGGYKTTKEIYEAFESLNLTAYQPSAYLYEINSNGRKVALADWDSDIYREMYLVKMMCVLFMKRLESSWFSLQSTVKKVLDVHTDTLDMLLKYETDGIDSVIRGGDIVEDEDMDELFVRRRQIKVSDIKNFAGFKKGLLHDCELLRQIYDGLVDFENRYRNNQEHDLKLDDLVKILNEKQESPNKKVVIFTAYADTAKFLFDELNVRGFSRMASVSGLDILTTGSHSKKNFTEVLRSFAPYSKLYKELDWDGLYEEKLDVAEYYDEEKQRWNVPYELWSRLVCEHRPEYARLLNDGIDILIATDCLSEGQNLQDADMQINYDIHWNPVRLIQRFGRIDRIGSPNETISCVNFWPAKSFEEYLGLQTRIQNRMSIMNLVGSETQDLNEGYRKMVEDNPLQNKNADRLLEELKNNSISDIESPQTLSLKDFSFETYRQELADYFEEHKDFYRRMPNGIFSGFKNQSPDYQNMPENLIALVGYPKKPEGKKEHTYTELYLVCQPVDANPSWVELNKAEILDFLRKNKKTDRFVPEWIIENGSERVERLSNVLKQWMRMKAPKQAQVNIKTKLRSRIISSSSSNSKEQLVEEKFRLQNFDLIVWEYITSDNA